MENLKKKLKRWEEETVALSLQRFPEQKDDFRTGSGIKVNRVYTPLDTEQVDYLEDLGLPGEYPFTRGVQATGYRAKLWTRRPITGFQTAQETNERFKMLLKRGQTGLHFVFDYPTLSGLGAGHPLAIGEVGRGGIPMNTLRDMEILLDGVEIDKITLSFSYWGPIILAMLIAVADQRGISREKIQGTLQNDVLMYYHSCPWFELPLKPNMKMFVDVVEFAVKNMPKWNVVNISGYNIREGGCSATQEVAFTLGDAMAYIDACLERGLCIDEFVQLFSFHLDVHNDFFEEICKMRALRRMWAKIIKQRYGAKESKSMLFRFHSQTAGSTYTAQQPLSNVIRGTLQAMAAVLGGTQSLHVSSYDEALSLPTEEAASLSVNTQNIIAFESGVCRTVDPLGGSYYVESLTNQIEEEAWGILAEIEQQGGMVKAALNGWIQQQKTEFMEQHLKKVEKGEEIIVGVNYNVLPDEKQIELLSFSEQFEEEYIDNLKSLIKSRDNSQVEKKLQELRKACEAGENVVNATIEAVKSYATLGEMYSIFRTVWGEMQQHEMLSSIGYK